MKTLIKNLFFIGMGVAFFASCKKDENIDYFNGGTTPVLTASVSGTIPLSNATQNNVAVTFSWTNPNYAFTTGVSSQNVSYLLEIDTLGANFTSPLHLSTSVSPDLGLAYVDAALNSALSNQMLLVPGIKHTIQVRITASLNSVTNTKLVSNVLQFTVTPWTPPPVIAPPSSGTLVLVGGDPLIGAWANNAPAPAKQIFTKVSNTEYKLTIQLSGGDPTQGSDQFLVLPVAGDWSNKYACVAANNTSAGGTFGYNLNDNFPGPTAAGTYVIDFNFQTGKYTVTKQ